MANDAHHWRRTSDAKYETPTQSRRPVHVLCWVQSGSCGMVVFEVSGILNSSQGCPSRILVRVFDLFQHHALSRSHPGKQRTKPFSASLPKNVCPLLLQSFLRSQKGS